MQENNYLKKVLKMAMRLELPQEAEQDLSIIMTELGIKTKTKAITFLISQYLLLEKQLKKTQESKEEYKRDLTLLVESIQIKEKAEKTIQGIAISQNIPNAKTVKAIQSTDFEVTTMDELRAISNERAKENQAV